MQSATVYTVPTVHMDVQESDCVEDMINALRQLNHVQTNMFQRIGARIKEEKQRYDSLIFRITTAKGKVNAIANLRGSRATTLFSSARFPKGSSSKESQNTNNAGNGVEYKTIYGGLEDYERKSGFEDFDDDGRQHFPGNTNATSGPTSTSELLDLLWRSNQHETKSMLTVSGLGPLPSHLNAVSSTLLFNTNEMPYKKYDEQYDNVFEVKVREKEEEKKKKEMFAQGQTLLKGDDLPSVKALDMTYKPKMKAQPTLQFQTNLNFGADLPAVAADASWQGGEDNLNSIAPTVFQANLPALPSIEDSIPSPTAKLQNNNSNSTNPSGNNTNSAAPPPPPPAANNITAAPPPPPPPPANNSPPPIPPPATNTAPPKAKIVTETGIDPTAGNRGGLLAAIRNAGGAKKLKAKPKKERKTKPLPEKPKTLSLAEEMRMKLSRRANIMSGRADKEEQQKSKERRTSVLKAKVNSVNAFSKGLKGLKKAKKVETPTIEEEKEEKPKEEVGGFTTKNMGGLAALLKARETDDTRRDSRDSFASESDWDSD
jgi:hypothetical protein